MALIDDVLFYAKEIADNNNFVYGRWDSPWGNGAGAVAVPYHMDCCIYISYAIYLAKGWTWYNQPYGYYWPHPEEAGFDYFLVNTIGCDKYTWPNVPGGLQPGDIVITTPALGHTFMIYNQDLIADNSPGFALNNQVSLKPINTYGSHNYWYIYRMPGGSGAANLINQGILKNASDYGTDISWFWDLNVDPHTCAVSGISSSIRFNSIFWDEQNRNRIAIADTPFEPGKTYRLKYSGVNVRFRGYFYSDATSASISSFNVINDYDFTIPANCTYLIMRLWIAANTQVYETVAPSIYDIEVLEPPLPGADDRTEKIPIWMMLHPFI